MTLSVNNKHKPNIITMRFVTKMVVYLRLKARGSDFVRGIPVSIKQIIHIKYSLDAILDVFDEFFCFCLLDMIKSVGLVFVLLFARCK